MSDEVSLVRKDAAPVILPPPLLHAAAMTIAIAFDFFVHPISLLAMTGNVAGVFIGLGLVVAGLGLTFACLRLFKLADTDVRPWKPTTAVVRRGPYHFSRNPIYIGMVVAHAGTAFLLDSAWVLIFLLPMLPILHFGVVKREEAYLEAKFGDEYLAYKKAVRRWI